MDPNSTVALASAGKFLTHIAALQLVESGVVTLDEPVHKHLPELGQFQLISPDDNHENGFKLQPPRNRITLRHLLLHTSGICDSSVPIIQKYLDTDAAKTQFSDDVHPIIQHFASPLMFEPGEGFHYGWGINFTQLLVERLAGNYRGAFVAHVQSHIFDRLGMESSTYRPHDRPNIWESRLQMVEREGERGLKPADDQAQGLMCSITDIGLVFKDLLSPSPRLLNKENIELLLKPQLLHDSTALDHLRRNPDNYSFVTGKAASNPAVNWSFAGLVCEEEDGIPRSGLPKGTVTWEGWPNVLWSLNREEGLAMFFGTQLVPIGDKAANDLATSFMRNAWKTYR